MCYRFFFKTIKITTNFFIKTAKSSSVKPSSVAIKVISELLVKLQYMHCILDNYKIRLMYNKIDYEIDQNKIKCSRETVE